MKKLLMMAALPLLCAGIGLCNAQNVTSVCGRVMNAALGEPMEFASVALLRNDSIIVTGAMADIDGMFEMSAAPGEYLIRASFIGYRDLTRPLTLSGDKVDAGILGLEEDANMLKEIVVRSTLPKTEVKGDAVVTSIEGSVLEHSGSSLDVLAKVPGMIDRNGTLEVLGRGEPEYYINGRKLTDISELRNLMSEDVKSVEVISNPGALYGGEVRCVVRIRTVKRQGDGFSFALTSQAKKFTTCSDFDPSWSVLDLNYRKGGLDLFGKVVYWNNHNYQIADLYGGTNTVKDGKPLSHIQDGTLEAISHGGGMQYVLGANWQINDRHSLGFRLQRGDNIFSETVVTMDNDFIVNGTVEDHVVSVSNTRTPKSYQWDGNLYYDGNAGKLNINFNADFMIGRGLSRTEVNETSWTTPAFVKSESEADGDMVAAKLVLSYPLWKGKLEFGSEETYYTGVQTYSINLAEIPSADDINFENTIAGFAQYSIALPFGQIGAGLRYEHVDFRYEDKMNPANDLTRHLDDWFPSVNYSTKLGEVGLALSYTGKTIRPKLYNLTNEISYDNRYTRMSGDPKLLSEIQRTLALNANWRWLSFSSTYEREDNHITQWSYPYNDEGVIILRYTNMKDVCRILSMNLTASPTIGVWNPRLTLGYSKPYLKLHVQDQREPSGQRIVLRENPMYLIQSNNAFRLKHGWQLEFNYQFQSRMSANIANLTEPLHILDASVQKSFLKNDALTFNLSWNDILDGTHEHIDIDFGNYFILQNNDYRRPGVVLRVSYRFNSADSKYKGTGAGQSVKDRM